MGNNSSLNHSRRECKYHVVWISKYRRKTLYGQVRKYLGAVFRDLARWVERILSFKETCRLRAKATFPLLAKLIRNHFAGTQPDLAGI